MAKAATAFVEFQGDFSQIQSQTQTQAKGLEKSFGSSFKNIAKAAAVSFAVVGVGKLLKSSFSQAEEAQKVARQTDAVIKSTGGVADVSKGHVDKLAESLQGVSAVDDDVIKAGENILLTFTDVKNEAGKGNQIFDQAAKAALDMSKTFGTDLQSNIVQVGKALQDPLGSLGQLHRAGVNVDKLKPKIKALVDAGDKLGAQKAILKELSTEFGGAAAAAATPSERLKTAVGNLEESLGKLLLPVVKVVADALEKLATWLDKNHGVAVILGGVLATLAGVFVGMLVVAKVAKTIEAFSKAMKALNIVLAENPIILVIGALILLGIGLFIAYKKVKPFHDAIDFLWQLLQKTFNWVKKNWPLLLAILTGPFGLAVRFIVQHWDGIVKFFKGIVSQIGGVFKNIAAVIVAPYRAAFNAIAKLWNATIGKLHFKVPSWVPGIGGKGFDVPDIPTFASGGIFSASSGSGLALLHSGEGVFTPGQMAAMGNSGIDARTIVQGNVYGDSHLRRIFEDHDRQLALTLAAG